MGSIRFIVFKILINFQFDAGSILATNSKASDLIEHFRIKLNLLIPEFADVANFKDWAWALLEQKNWSADAGVSSLESVVDQQRLFVQAFLQTTRLLCELGRLPVFDIPRVISLSKEEQNSEKYLLEIELFLVEFVPQDVYKIPIKASAELCRWMAQNNPSSENKNIIYNHITEKVIKPLNRLVPAGKSTVPLLRVAHSLGIPFHHLGLGVYQLGWGSKARRLDRSTCELDSAIGSKLAQNKVSTANILRAAGLPAPVHGIATTENDAISLAKKIGFPVVLKPTDRERGEGVTVDISDEAGLKTALAHAQKLAKSKQVIVERQVSGVCHRLFVANCKLLYAVKRHPMSVIGDGNRTIQELVDAEVAEQNKKPPFSRSEIKPIDDLALKAFELLGLSAKSIPDKGVMVPLRRIESTEWGGVDEEVSDVIHPENVDIALEAAKLFGLQVAGIDIISPEITKPWHANGAIINEVNFAPLFGGAEISRSHIPKFFAEFIEGDGKIPIEVFDTEKAALMFQKEQAARGKRCYITTEDRTINELGKEFVMPLKDLRQRIRALIFRSDVNAIAIVQKEKNS
jgi:cyanophycin synthetase